MRSVLAALACTAGMLASHPALAGPRMGLQLPTFMLVVPSADLDRPRAKRAARPHRHAYREWYTPGQHWQPWLSGRHHRYWHGGVTSAFCYGIISIPDRRCYERDW